MPNALAYLMLMIWPLACLVMMLRLPLERAIVWCILGGYLLLPPLANFDLPLVPAMDKFSIPSVAAFLICIVVLRRRIGLLPRTPLVTGLMLLFLFSVVPTVLTNPDPIVFQVMPDSEPIRFVTHQLPGLTPRDIFSVLTGQVIVLLPFLMARQFLSTETGMRELLLATALGGAAYSLPALLEIRLSPQLNTWIYGFFQHSFEQMMRDGGFRPIVFLPHALWLAFFLMTACMATAALARVADPGQRLRWMVLLVYLLVVLYLSKSLASQAYALMMVPAVLILPARWQLRLACLFALVAIAWPVLRNLELVPLEAILAQAEAVNPDRAQSLGYRFENEELLLQRADEKELFGWGGWGRNLVRHPETGRILSVPDGRWIIVFGTFGWVGYVAEMGLLAAPLFLTLFQLRRMDPAALSPFLAPIAMILAITMIDMLLNATLVPLTWLYAGAVLGHVERLRHADFDGGGRRTFGDGPVMGRLPRSGDRRSVM